MSARDTWFHHHHHLTAIDMVGVAHHRHALGNRLESHRHADHWELCFIDGGSVHWWVGDEVYEVPPGCWYLTQPGEEHGAMGGIMEPCRLGWVQISQAGPAIAGFSAAESDYLRSILATMPRVIPSGSSRWPLWDELRRTFRLEDGPLTSASRRHAIAGLLLALVVDLAANAEQGPSPAIAQAVTWMHQHADQAIVLAELAQLVGLGRSRFAQRFKLETGYTPADYSSRLRVLQAQRLLRDEERSVTDVALDLGFSSSQYFAATFRRYTGMTPTEWRKVADGYALAT